MSEDNQSLSVANASLQQKQEEALKEKESMAAEMANLRVEKDELAKAKEFALDANKQLARYHQNMKEVRMKANDTCQERARHVDRVIDKYEIEKENVYHQCLVLVRKYVDAQVEVPVDWSRIDYFKDLAIDS